MSDNISRQAAIDAANRADYDGFAIEHVRKVTDEVIKEILKIPSTDRKGYWVEDEYGISHCSECGAVNVTVYRNFCPECGAEMACDDYEYERAVEQLEHDIMFEPTYDVEDGSM